MDDRLDPTHPLPLDSPSRPAGDGGTDLTRRRMLRLGSALPALGMAGLASAQGLSLVTADPRDYGAAGDGECDDAAALQLALDSSLCVKLSPGTYRIDKPLELRDFQILLGCGSTLVGCGSRAGIRRKAGTQFISGPVLRDLSFRNFSVAVDAAGMNRGTFENLHVQASGVGFRLAITTRGYCYYNVFTACHTVGEGAGGVATGILFEGVESERFGGVRGANGNTFRGCKVGGEKVCMEVRAPVSNLAFYACAFERALDDIPLLELGVQRDLGCQEEDLRVDEVLFSGCRFEGGKRGVRLHVGPYARGCHFLANVISGSVKVIDEGTFINWFPHQQPGEHRIGYSLDPNNNGSARIGDWRSAQRLFHTVNARTLQAVAPADAFFNAYAAPDQSAPLFRISRRGHLEWAPADGTSPPDTNLYRRGTTGLRTDNLLSAAAVEAGSFAATDADDRVSVLVRGAASRVMLRDAAGNDTVVLDGRTGRITSRNGDCAEELEITDGEAAEPGDVLVIGADGLLMRCRQPYDQRVAGIVAGAGGGQPAILLGRKAASTRGRSRPLALAGRVFCHVDAGRGAVAAGDLLTTSATPGHAMKCADPSRAHGAVIGKALANLPAGRGLVPVLVGAR